MKRTVETSRLPGFYKLSLEQRRSIAAAALGISVEQLRSALSSGGLDEERADKSIENVIGTYSLPFGLGLNVVMNGKDYLVPMVVEEPSVVAAASNAARMIRKGGGFRAEADPPVMIAQIQLRDVQDSQRAIWRLQKAKSSLLAEANTAIENVVRRGGGAIDLEMRDLGEGILVVHLLVNSQDAMGANLVNTAAERISSQVAKIAGGVPGLRILSNLSDRRKVRVWTQVPVSSLGAGEDFPGEKVCEDIVAASRFAELDPYRASTHNKGIFNGIDAVVIATGNDWRAVEAGGHAFAARSGSYQPLCTWRRDEEGNLCGFLEMPLALGIVGGPIRIHKAAKLALQLAGVRSATELAMLAGCMGVASNLAALRALVTAGIQKGHMALHARTVAIAAGAEGSMVERVADEIHRSGNVTLAAASDVLRQLQHKDVEGLRLSA